MTGISPASIAWCVTLFAAHTVFFTCDKEPWPHRNLGMVVINAVIELPLFLEFLRAAERVGAHGICLLMVIGVLASTGSFDRVWNWVRTGPGLTFTAAYFWAAAFHSNGRGDRYSVLAYCVLFVPFGAAWAWLRPKRAVSQELALIPPPATVHVVFAKSGKWSTIDSEVLEAGKWVRKNTLSSEEAAARIFDPELVELILRREAAESYELRKEIAPLVDIRMLQLAPNIMAEQGGGPWAKYVPQLEVREVPDETPIVIVRTWDPHAPCEDVAVAKGSCAHIARKKQ